jgi:hypothetical protein
LLLRHSFVIRIRHSSCPHDELPQHRSPGGRLAFLIPLIIHLLNKRKVVTVRWGAMHLLHEVIRQRKRKMKIEQLLLLITRIAIPIVLALCLARPVLTALRSLGLGSSSLIVMLDDSFSMRAPAAQTFASRRHGDGTGAAGHADDAHRSSERLQRPGHSLRRLAAQTARSGHHRA